MGPASVVVGILAIVCAMLSFALVAVPMAGVSCGIAAMIFSLVSIVLGGVGMSQATDRRESTSLSVAGLVIGILAFLMSFVITMTCGTCNACVTMLDAHYDGGFPIPPPGFPAFDADASFAPPYDADAGKPPLPGDPDPDADARAPATGPSDGGIAPPPPAFPPPPMDRIGSPRSMR